jgi:hypothetical protein
MCAAFKERSSYEKSPVVSFIGHIQGYSIYINLSTIYLKLYLVKTSSHKAFFKKNLGVKIVSTVVSLHFVHIFYHLLFLYVKTKIGSVEYIKFPVH